MLNHYLEEDDVLEQVNLQRQYNTETSTHGWLNHTAYEQRLTRVNDL